MKTGVKCHVLIFLSKPFLRGCVSHSWLLSCLHFQICRSIFERMVWSLIWPLGLNSAHRTAKESFNTDVFTKWDFFIVVSSACLQFLILMCSLFVMSSYADVSTIHSIHMRWPGRTGDEFYKGWCRPLDTPPRPAHCTQHCVWTRAPQFCHWLFL